MMVPTCIPHSRASYADLPGSTRIYPDLPATQGPLTHTHTHLHPAQQGLQQLHRLHRSIQIYPDLSGSTRIYLDLPMTQGPPGPHLYPAQQGLQQLNRLPQIHDQLSGTYSDLPGSSRAPCCT